MNTVKLTQEDMGILAELFHMICEHEGFGWVYEKCFETMDLSDDRISELLEKLRPVMNDADLSGGMEFKIKDGE